MRLSYAVHTCSINCMLNIYLCSVEVDVNNNQEMLKIISSAIGTKMISKWSKLACDVALKAVKTVSLEKGGRKEVDIKRYVRIEKVRGNIINGIHIYKAHSIMFLN